MAPLERAKITVFSSHKCSKIDRNIYGGFTEHMGRCIYGGLFDPDNKNADLIDENGFRLDVIEAMKEIEIPVVRYPGGNFVATYHWLDGVGKRSDRQSRPDPAWSGVESNQFGTDEFMKWCEIVGTEPYLCLNMGTGTLDEALGWVEYCNSDKNTYYANLRRQNGREKPYGVKYWALGNECWGPWQVGQLTKEDYAKKAYQWAKALKRLDPAIHLILCGETGLSNWDTHVLQHCLKPDPHIFDASGATNLIDMHSIHLYTASDDPIKNAFAPLAAERAIEVCSGLIDLARIDNQVDPAIPRPKICFDEWNVWNPLRAPGDLGAEEVYTLSDALAVAVWLNVFVRQSGHVGMANIAQSVNVISPLMTTADGLVKQTTWWPLLLFSKYMRGWNIAVDVQCSAYEGQTEPKWLKGIKETAWLDVSATIDDEGMVNLAVVNVCPDRQFEILGGVEAVMENYIVTGSDWKDANTGGKEIVGFITGSHDGREVFRVLPKSFTLFRWKHSEE